MLRATQLLPHTRHGLSEQRGLLQVSLPRGQNDLHDLHKQQAPGCTFITCPTPSQTNAVNGSACQGVTLACCTRLPLSCI